MITNAAINSIKIYRNGSSAVLAEFVTTIAEDQVEIMEEPQYVSVKRDYTLTTKLLLISTKITFKFTTIFDEVKFKLFTSKGMQELYDLDIDGEKITNSTLKIKRSSSLKNGGANKMEFTITSNK